MTYERDHDLDSVRETASATIDAAIPGRRSASAGLEPPAHPMASGLIQRKARDVNGVAADADTAVAAAASTSGSELPVGLQRTFESSLGANLSSVRVHTGGASETAAQAVGARAYTVGQDIQFGAGQYDPSSTGGQHLIAHEVAHTVQQRGGSSMRQNKLEVSSPGDFAEIEADRAADAMVAGQSISVAQAGSTVAREPTTSVNNGNYQTVLEGGETAESSAQQENQILEGTTAYLDASTQGDRAQATTLLNHVRQGSAEVLAAQADDPESATDKMQAANLAAKEEIEAYLTAAAKQDVMQGQFEPELQKTNVQYARLEGMYQSACVNLGIKGESANFDSKRGESVAMGGSDGYAFDAKQDVKEQAVSTKGGSAPSQKLRDSEITLCKANITRIEADMLKLPAQIGVATSELKASHANVNAAVATVALPPPVRQPTEEQAKCQAQIAAAKRELDQVVTVLNTAASLATTGFGAIKMGGSGAGPTSVGSVGEPIAIIDNGISNTPGKHGNGTPFPTPVQPGIVDAPDTKGSAGDVVLLASARDHISSAKGFAEGMSGAKFDFIEGVASAIVNYEQRVASANGMIDAITDATTKQAMKAVIATALAEKEVLRVKLKTLRRLRTEMELAKTLLRKEVEILMTKIDGNRTKDGSGPDYGVVIAFQSEATIFLAQVDTTIQIGMVEREAAREVNPNAGGKMKEGPAGAKPASAANITNSQNHASEYWMASKGARPAGMPNADKPFWTYSRHTVVMKHSSQGVVDDRMDELMNMLKDDKQRVEGFRAKLKEFSGI